MDRPRVLVGDVGGTNTRLAWADAGRPHAIRHFRNADADGLAEIVAAFVGAGPAPAQIRLAVAAPVTADGASLTNLDWRIEPAVLAAELGAREVRLLNDFEALGHALPGLRAGDLSAIGGGRALDDAPALVLGPGTGFGAS
ncbi:MAG: glucokinase, partial [Gammaproteobacteria bacterium]